MHRLFVKVFEADDAAVVYALLPDTAEFFLDCPANFKYAEQAHDACVFIVDYPCACLLVSDPEGLLPILVRRVFLDDLKEICFPYLMAQFTRQPRKRALRAIIGVRSYLCLVPHPCWIHVLRRS